jgi:SAM-dependent methyltransferase
MQQDKAAERAFFNAHAAHDSYDVFQPIAKARIIDRFVALTRLQRGARVIDLGCGSGAFTALLRARGYDVVGLDIAEELVEVGRSRFPNIEFVQGDIEDIPFPEGAFDGILLSGVLHHFDSLSRCIEEVRRVLRPGGRFMAFDPNRLNPFFYLYRDPSSPLYSDIGVTRNERPILAWEVARAFHQNGFAAGTEYLGRLPYGYIASGAARRILPVYNAVERIISAPNMLKSFRPFVLTYGERLPRPEDAVGTGQREAVADSSAQAVAEFK